MKLSDLMNKNEKYYEYIIRTVVPITEENLNDLAFEYRRFHLLEIEGPNETIIQDKPLDFYEIGPSKVWMIKIKTQLPASLAALQELTRNFFKVVDKMVVVRSAIGIDELTTCVNNQNNEIENDSIEKNLVIEPLSANPNYTNEQPLEKVLPNSQEHLNILFAKHQEMRKEQPDKIELPNKLFVWLKIPDLEINVPNVETSTINVSNVGNMVDNFKVKKRFYDPKTGKIKEIEGTK